MTTPDFDAAIEHALRWLEAELSPRLVYHNLWHTRDDVMPAAQTLARACELEAHEQRLLMVAAAYHDIGFICQYEDHERAGAALARELLPQFGFGGRETERVGELILATCADARPADLSQAIIADADLDVLGRDDFLSRNDALWQEVLIFAPPTSRQAWLQEQLAFLRGRRYFTAAARALRREGRRQNIRRLQQVMREEARLA